MNKHPGPYIKNKVIPEGMTNAEAAERLKIGRPALSRMLNGKAALSPELAEKIEALWGTSSEKLLKMQAEYDALSARTSSIMTPTPYSPIHQQVLGREISAWGNAINARTRLPVLLRTLIHSTSREIITIDFPGNDSGEKPGWDGFLDSAEASSWVPKGKSGWEFGCTKKVGGKANSDYKNRTDGTDSKERKDTTFIFVTPQSWAGKTDWVKDKNAEGEWKEVRAYDASDFEQWIEQSIAAQEWFSHETGRPTNGVSCLDEVWETWTADSEPELGPQLFDQAIISADPIILNWAKKPEKSPLVIVADSVIEGLAFIKVVLDSINDDNILGYSERALVFSSGDMLKALLTKNSRIIPVIHGAEAERTFANFSKHLKSIIVYPRNAFPRDADISLDPLGCEAFRSALEKMGCNRDYIDRLSLESGRSLTVLRRRLSQLEAVKRPEWTTNASLARSLGKIALAGTWSAKNTSDQAIVACLADTTNYAEIEQSLNQLLMLDDAPVWSVGQYRGVISKIDSLYAIASSITAQDLNRFFDCCELVLSEDDPSLDLPKEDQWAASMYGKTREISGGLRKALAEMAVLLAVHGNNLFQQRTGIDIEAKANNLVRSLIFPLTVRVLEAHNSDLPHYAEIAPDTFLSILEDDLKSGQKSACLQVIKPEDTGIFGGHHARTGLLWALEKLAWSEKYFLRTVNVLATLSGKKLEDNLANKPINSLMAIFRAWMPQTSADLEQRKKAFDYLTKKFPEVAWEIAVEQFNNMSRMGHYSEKPKWRDYGYGHGEPVSYEERRLFVVHCLEACLNWKKYGLKHLSALIEQTDGLPNEYQARIWDKIKAWAEKATNEEKSILREKVRVTAYSRRATLRAKGDNNYPFDPAEVKAVYNCLKPDDLVWEHEWLFRDFWLLETIYDSDSEEDDYNARQALVEKQRVEALKLIFQKLGKKGIFHLTKIAGAKTLIGQLMVKALGSPSKSIAFIQDIGEENSLSDEDHDNLIIGVMCSVSEATLEEMLNLAEKELTAQQFDRFLRLAPFAPITWSKAESTPARNSAYWENVTAGWAHEDHVAQAVRHLLDHSRPLAALNLAGSRMEHIQPRKIFQILDTLTKSKEDSQDVNQMRQYHISEAFKLLDADSNISKKDLAQLEFRYLRVLENSDYGIPNLENEIVDNPAQFVEAVAYSYRRSDDGVDPDWLNVDDKIAQDYASLMFHFFNRLKTIPGSHEKGDDQTKYLIKWIKDVRQSCRELARSKPGDSEIGHLLSKAPVGEDGVWPCEPVRDALEELATDSMIEGFRVGKYNQRGVVCRGEGGDQERVLEKQYRDWATKLRSTHPVVSGVLNQMADRYLSEAKNYDTEAIVQSRIPY